jgi:hypothetical protein
MKQLDFDGLVKISNEGLKALKGGVTMHSVTVIAKRKPKKQSEYESGGCSEHGNQCDGDDNVHDD